MRELCANRRKQLKRVTAPSEEPVTLDEVKLYLRVDQNFDDDLIADLIVAARMSAESWLRQSLVTQSWKLSYADGVSGEIWLPMGPVNSIISISTVDRTGLVTLVDSSAYHLPDGSVLEINNGINAYRVDILYAAGFGAASAVPSPVKRGMLTHIAALYDERGEGGLAGLPEQSMALYMPFRELRL